MQSSNISKIKNAQKGESNSVEKAYKFRIYPNNEQIQQIQKTFGCCRFLYNHFLAKRIEQYRLSKETLNYNDCSATLTEMKLELTWLKEADATALQSSLKDLVSTSDGISHTNHKYIKQSEKKLAKAQRQLSRKQIDSRNRDKARIRVAKILTRKEGQEMPK